MSPSETHVLLLGLAARELRQARLCPWLALPLFSYGVAISPQSILGRIYSPSTQTDDRIQSYNCKKPQGLHLLAGWQPGSPPVR